MADFKRRFKDLLGFGGNESVAYDDSAEDEYDYSDYDETEDGMEEEAEEDPYEASRALFVKDCCQRVFVCKPKPDSGRSSVNSYRSGSAGTSERSRVLSMARLPI